MFTFKFADSITVTMSLSAWQNLLSEDNADFWDYDPAGYAWSDGIAALRTLNPDFQDFEREYLR